MEALAAKQALEDMRENSTVMLEGLDREKRKMAEETKQMKSRRLNSFRHNLNRSMNRLDFCFV